MNDEQQLAYVKLAGITKEALTRSEAHAKATHERFNVFTCLLKDDDEVRLHTRFIHCLLNPDGAHECGTLFLDLFFQMLEELEVVCGKDDESRFFIPSEGRRWTVSKETRRGDFGQIDLLLESHDGSIAIENKINAREQHKQLFGYSKYLEGRQNGQFTTFRIALFYLTLDGKDGYSAGESEYFRISYKKHILNWLDKCLLASNQIIPINQVLIQYHTLVRHLTKQNISQEFMEPINEFVRGNPDILRVFKEIQNSVQFVVDAVWMNLQVAIENDLKAEFEVVPKYGQGLAAGDDGAIILEPLSKSDFTGAPFRIWIERDKECLGIGVCIDGIQGSSLPEIQSYRRFSSLQSDALNLEFNHKFDPGATHRFPFGWLNLLEGNPNEQAAELLDDTTSRKVCSDVKKYIELLKRANLQILANEDR